MDPEKLTNMVDSCVFDLCQVEDQDDLRCKAFEEFNKDCLSLGKELNLQWMFNWRNKTNCRNANIIFV